ncbi:hypothetical protein JB92DRAFT_2828556 [Gautieria morchelliformis]|nr:hypothetical protein JB92DRAFT_2828556 [Gautieria morchelliformis]
MPVHVPSLVLLQGRGAATWYFTRNISSLLQLGDVVHQVTNASLVMGAGCMDHASWESVAESRLLHTPSPTLRYQWGRPNPKQQHPLPMVLGTPTHTSCKLRAALMYEHSKMGTKTPPCSTACGEAGAIPISVPPTTHPGEGVKVTMAYTVPGSTLVLTPWFPAPVHVLSHATPHAHAPPSRHSGAFPTTVTASPQLQMQPPLAHAAHVPTCCGPH